jgi:hypothetical protein
MISGKKGKKHIFTQTLNMSTPEKNSNSEKSQNTAEKKFEIPVEGSLGILALGAAGIKAWRKKREEALAEKNSKNGGSNG